MLLSIKPIIVALAGITIVSATVYAFTGPSINNQQCNAQLVSQDNTYVFPKDCYVFDNINIGGKTETEVTKLLITERDKRIPEELKVQIGTFKTTIPTKDIKINKADINDYVSILKRYADMKVINEYKDITLISLVHVDFDSLKEKVVQVIEDNNIEIDRDEFNDLFTESFFSDKLLEQGIIIKTN